MQNGQISLVFEDLDFDTYKLLSVSWLDPANPNPACNQAVWGTHSGSIQAFMQMQYLLHLVQKTLN